MASPHEQDYTSARKGLHRIEDDLAENGLEDWAAAGLAEIEESLGKHALFLAFLDTQGGSSDESSN